MIYTIGETVLDILFSNNQPFSAKAGGAMLNTAISLGRLNVPVSFISEFADDRVGEQIFNFLNENTVDTTFVYKHKTGKTSLALAYLDNKGDANYTFYKLPPADRLKIKIPEFTEMDFLLFGSYFSIDPLIRASLKQILDKAKQKGTFIIYDPNFRKPHLPDLEKLRTSIDENILYADIIRASDQDFLNIFKIDNGSESYETICKTCKYFIYTKAENGVELFTPQYKKNYNSEKIVPVSTVGAGDTFNAAIIFNLYKNLKFGKKIGDYNLTDFDKMIRTGIEMSSQVCLSEENYISKNFAEKINSLYGD